jgi:sulfate adenylyltransferase subunit 2
MDIWQYIHAENIPIVPMYFAQEREVLVRGDSLIMLEQPFIPHVAGRKTANGALPHAIAGLQPLHRRHPVRRRHAFRKSSRELVSFRRSERENRVIDHDQDGSMEIKKREGYF